MTGRPRTERPGASQVIAERQPTGRHDLSVTPPARSELPTAPLKNYPQAQAAAADTQADTRRACPPAPRGDR